MSRPAASGVLGFFKAVWTHGVRVRSSLECLLLFAMSVAVHLHAPPPPLHRMTRKKAWPLSRRNAPRGGPINEPRSAVVSGERSYFPVFFCMEPFSIAGYLSRRESWANATFARREIKGAGSLEPLLVF